MKKEPTKRVWIIVTTQVLKALYLGISKIKKVLF